MDLKKLSNEELIRRVSFLASEERRITLDILIYLKEIERRRLHLERGFSSMYDFAVKELKYSEGSAYRRLQAMRLLKDLPDTEKNILDGTLNITNAAKIQTALKNKPVAEKAETLSSLLGKPGKDVDQELSKNLPAREGMRWLTPDAVELRVQLAKHAYTSLEELKALKSNTPGRETFGSVMEDLIDLGQEKWNPLQRRASSQRRSSASRPSPPIPTNPRYLSPTLRREIWQRDRNQCTYVDPDTGNRCEKKHFLHIDHIHPLALGGTSTPENLRLLCQAHNSLRAIKTYGAKPT